MSFKPAGRWLLLSCVLILLTACGGSTSDQTGNSSNQLPVASFTVDNSSGVVQFSVNFDASSSTDPDGNIVRYAWNFGDGNNAEGLQVSHTYNQVGTYAATLTITDNLGAEDRSSRQINVLRPVNNLAPNAAFAVDVSTGTTPLTVAFDATASYDSDGSITHYEWDFGDGFSGSGAQLSHTYYLEGSHTATLTVTDNDGAQQTATQLISVAGVPNSYTLSGTVFITSSPEVDWDINDISADYQSNNTASNAQPLTTGSLVVGYVTRQATGVAGQRFESQADEIDVYRVTLARNQSLTLTIADHASQVGMANPSDLDLYLFDVNNVDTPVASSLSTASQESLTVPGDGEYYILVHAFEGMSNYLLDLQLALTATDTAGHLSLDDELLPGQVVARLKSSPESTRDIAGISQKTAALSQQHQLTPLRGQPQRAMLFERPKPVPGLNQKSQQIFNDIFDGRSGFRLNAQQRERYETLKIVKQLRHDPEIDYAEPNFLLQGDLQPNDPMYSDQWHYAAINLPQAWDTTTGSSSVIVAVLDTGVFMAHQDLSGNLLATGYDMISNISIAADGDSIDSNPDDPGDDAVLSQSSWHGTHVAGTVAASSNNSIGVAGVAHGIRIMPVRVLGRGGGTSYDVAQGILYAAGLSNDSGTAPAQAADIINMSLGGSGYSQTMFNAVTAARNAGVIIVAASGNDDSPDPHYPSAFAGVISVGAVGMTNQRAYYSNYGNTLDLVAPGGDTSLDSNNDGFADRAILSTLVDTSSGSRQSGYAYYQGTSMATPHVAGVVALMKSIYPALSPSLLDGVIQNGSITTDLGADGANTRNDNYGYGLIDAQKAIQQAQALAGTGPAPNLAEAVASVSTMTVSSQQSLQVNLLSGSLSVASVQTNFAWASVSADSVDGNGIGSYTLDIDRSGLTEGVYSLVVTFTMDNGDLYPIQISVVEYDANAIISNVGPVYLLLIDALNWNNALNRTLVAQARGTRIDGHYTYNFSNILPGDYVIFAGTDRDGDRLILDEGESYGAYGEVNNPTTVTISGSDINNIDITNGGIGTGSSGAIELIE